METVKKSMAKRSMIAIGWGLGEGQTVRAQKIFWAVKVFCMILQ